MAAEQEKAKATKPAAAKPGARAAVKPAAAKPIERKSPLYQAEDGRWVLSCKLKANGVRNDTKESFTQAPRLFDKAGNQWDLSVPVYSGAKGGVIAFTKTIAREVARSGVTANIVCPGPTDTPPLLKTVAQGGEKFISALTKAIPVGRLGLVTPETAAEPTRFSWRAGVMHWLDRLHWLIAAIIAGLALGLIVGRG